MGYGTEEHHEGLSGTGPLATTGCTFAPIAQLALPL